MSVKTCKIHNDACGGINHCNFNLECAKARKKKIISENKSKGITMESYTKESKEKNKYYPFTSKEEWLHLLEDNPYWPCKSYNEFKEKYENDKEYLLNTRPSCTVKELDRLIKKEEVNGVDVVSEAISSVKQYFNYQEDINMYKDKLSKLEDAQKDLMNDIKTDVEDILSTYNYNELGTEIKITNTGLKIRIPVKIYNDHDICYKIDTDLFTQLNNLMGMHGRLNIENKTKYAGNMVYHIELIYELEE